ncbi:MAG: TatD family deoxyribonuclease [Candidatus Kapabacteria bacterium]|nr:TatD family deoxyribonuclease [Candidatus Kapabacteria bacterium]
MKYIDAHSHRRASDPDVTSVVSIRINSETEVFETDGICTVGLHPWDVNADWRDVVDMLEDLLEEELVVGIGECGLDRASGSPWTHQVDAFEYISELAERTSRPLIIHCVKAHDELLRIQKFIKPSQPWVLHGFVKGADLAKQCLDAGMYLSFGPTILRESPALIEALRLCPADRFLLETDNEETPITDVYSAAAAVRGVSIEELCAIQQQTFETVFKR